MKSCQLFLENVRAVATEFPNVKMEDVIIDTCAMRLVTNPESFDVLVTTNLFGDILSEVASGVVGGLGVAASANIGEGRAMFEPVGGAAFDIAGKRMANPLGMILCGAMLLDWLGEVNGAVRVYSAVSQVLTRGPLTRDLGGHSGTEEVTGCVLKLLETPTQEIGLVWMPNKKG